MESFSEKVTSEDLRVEEEAPIWGQVPGRGESRCKSPEACSRNWEKPVVPLEQGRNGKRKRKMRVMTVAGVASLQHCRCLGLILRKMGNHGRLLGRVTACSD